MNSLLNYPKVICFFSDRSWMFITHRHSLQTAILHSSSVNKELLLLCVSWGKMNVKFNFACHLCYSLILRSPFISGSRVVNYSISSALTCKKLQACYWVLKGSSRIWGRYCVKWVRWSIKSLIVIVCPFNCYSIYALLDIVSSVIQIPRHVNACLWIDCSHSSPVIIDDVAW